MDCIFIHGYKTNEKIHSMRNFEPVSKHYIEVVENDLIWVDETCRSRHDTPPRVKTAVSSHILSRIKKEQHAFHCISLMN